MTMSVLRTSSGSPTWSVRRASRYVVALHVPFVVAPPLFVLTRHHDVPVETGLALVLTALCLGALQLRHSLAAVRGIAPVGWRWTYVAICALAYGPAVRFGLDWASTTAWLVVASAAMLLPRTLAIVVVVAATIGSAVWVGELIGGDEHGSVIQVIVWMLYYVVLTLVGGAALYGSTRLVGVLDQLNAARTELAELAVGRERLRVSRDLHDLLGHSLSAVSLKGDLALRLLASDPDAARVEIESLTGLARTTLRDMRAVAYDEHAVSLSNEVATARTVLAAAGVRTQVELDLPDLSARQEAVLAWAVREGATNILRHSDARDCQIAATCTGGLARLEIVNDGAANVDGPSDGHGLAGLNERARVVSGSTHARRLSGGRFQLLVQIPGAPA